MEESKQVNYKEKVIQTSNCVQRILENFKLDELLKWRLFNKKMAGELVPRCVKHLICELPDANESDDDYTFHKILKYAKKVEIQNIEGTESHFAKISEIAD